MRDTRLLLLVLLVLFLVIPVSLLVGNVAELLVRHLLGHCLAFIVGLVVICLMTTWLTLMLGRVLLD